MNEGYDISLVIPCYNEEKNVSLFYKECSCIFNKKKLNVQYIFINDGSRDETFNEIRILASENKNIVGISFSRNFGKESAIYAGLKKSSGKYTCIIDADLQQNPKYVVEMYNYILNNTEYDSVCCYQEKRKEGFIKSILKKIFYKFINSISDVKFYKNASDFRLFNRKVLNSLLELKEYYRFSKGFFSWIGYKTYYMPYEVENRKYGKTTWSLFSLFRYAVDGIVGFSIRPLKIATFVGIVSFIMSVLYLIIILIQKLFVGISISGYATIVCLILFFGSLQMIFLGIIGEYLGRTYMETKKRAIYIIDEEINGNEGN